MARSSGGMVMNGSRDGEYSMIVEFSDERMPVPLRRGGYYRGYRTCADMVEELGKVSVTGTTVGATTGMERADASVGNRVAEDTDEVRNVESQNSNGNSSRSAMDFVEEVRERSRSVAGLPLQAEPCLGVSLLRDCEVGGEVEITEVDEYVVFIGEQSNLVSLCVLPLEFGGRELRGSSVSTSEVCLCGKSGGLYVMRSVTSWKLTFPEHESFRILVMITEMSGAKRWVKLEKPRSGYKEAAEDVYCVAKFIAFLKQEPHSSEDRVRNHLLEGDVLSATFCDHLRKQRSLMEQYIDLDPALKEAGARKTLLSLTRENETNASKRVLLLTDDSSGEDDYPRVKKPKTDHLKPEDVSMREYESEGEFYDDGGMCDEDSESDEEFGDSLCIFCDDGGYLLCCDGPCMRSFHPRPKDGINTDCKTIGFPNLTDIEQFKRGWFCTNCKTKKHQCHICGELGDSDEALGSKRRVFVCDVASCGKFYHPKCVASELKPAGGEREALAKGIRAGEESFTCPLHRCKKCGKGEEKKERDLNLATCRRCPAAWHVKCLPRNLSFEGNEESNFEVRAWELGKRFIVYCTKHKILRDLGTPIRNHIKFREKVSEATITFKKPQKKVSIIGNERPGFRAKASSSAASQILNRTPDTASPATKKSSEDAAKRRVDDIVDKSRRAITEESVRAKLFLPTIYQEKEFNWMLKGRFDSILNGARAAMEKFNLDRNNWEDAKLKCAPEQVHAIGFEEDRLRTFLAPTLHGKRYTSYGRHFTKIEKLQKVVEALEPYIWDRDTIVDFSCGDNSFSRLLHDALSNSEKSNFQFKNFDIFTPKDTLGFERRDWLSVGVSDCGPGDNLVIGLNPPFAHTERFISHALSMNPRVLVFIIPPLKKPLSHYGYQCLLDDPTTMAEKSFFLPGSVHGLNDECLEQGNSVAPHLYIFGRSSVLGMSNPTLTANLSQQVRPSVKRAKRAKRAKPTPPSDPSDHLFIPPERPRGPRAISVRPQHMPERISRAPAPGSQMEPREILPPPPPLPQPRHWPPFRSSQFHDRPHSQYSQIPPSFNPYPPSEFRPPHHLDETYSPFEPGLFPNGRPQGLLRRDPRGLLFASGGLRPPAFERLPPTFEGLPPAFGGWLPADE